MWTVFIVTIVAMVVGFGSAVIFEKDDTLPEEISETIIERELNLTPNTIDFTPNTKEV